MCAYFYCIFIFLNSVFRRQAVHILVQSHVIPGCALADPVFYGYIAFIYFIVINLFADVAVLS